MATYLASVASAAHARVVCVTAAYCDYGERWGRGRAANSLRLSATGESSE